MDIETCNICMPCAPSDNMEELLDTMSLVVLKINH